MDKHIIEWYENSIDATSGFTEDGHCVVLVIVTNRRYVGVLKPLLKKCPQLLLISKEQLSQYLGNTLAGRGLVDIEIVQCNCPFGQPCKNVAAPWQCPIHKDKTEQLQESLAITLICFGVLPEEISATLISMWWTSGVYAMQQHHTPRPTKKRKLH